MGLKPLPQGCIEYFAGMQFNHLHFFVDDTATWHDKFVRTWGATTVPQVQPGQNAPGPGHTRVVCLGQVPLVLSAPKSSGDLVDRYLRCHPPGIGDVAFQVKHLEQTVASLVARGGTLLEPIQTAPDGTLRWCRVQGWELLSHTLVQPLRPGIWIPHWGDIQTWISTTVHPQIVGIDHAVVNVESGQLTEAVDWYVHTLAFALGNGLPSILPKSGLRSQVLAHPQGDAQLPINEPATT
jgi:4-hydroxyphenylpyruvate dioxygenase